MSRRITRVALLVLAVSGCSAGQDASDGTGADARLAVDPRELRIPYSDPLCAAFNAWPKDAPFRSDMVLWFRADEGVSLAADGTVAVWADQSGRGGRDAAPQFPGMRGPKYVPDAYGTLPALRGDGTEQLLINGGHGYAVGKESSLFVVASPSTAGSDGITFYNESTQGWQYAIEQSANGVQWFNASSDGLDGGDRGSFNPTGQEDTFLFTPSPGPGLHVYAESQRDGIFAAGYYDGPPVAWLANPVGPSLYVMSIFGGPGDAFDVQTAAGYDPQGVVISSGTFDTNGDLVEIIQYDRALGPAEVALVEAYLWVRWFADASYCGPR